MKPSAGWSAVARARLMVRLFIMFVSVITTEAHLAYAGDRHHSNNTAELSSIIEALAFVRPNGLVSRHSQACIFNDSRHAASNVLGHCPITRERLPGAHLPASPVTNPIKATNYYAVHLQSCAESCKRMCGPSCRSRSIRSYFKS